MAVLPVVASLIMYFGGVGVPEGRTHNGELVADGTQASDLGLPLPDANDPNWQVVLASTAECAPCGEFSKGLNNFHTAIGRERGRVSVAEVDAQQTELGMPAIWVIDPLGNVVLKFDPAVNPTLILNDLKKLLRLSKVG
jgi:hypothetical protein